MDSLGVAVVSHSRPEYLGEVLQSLRAQRDQHFTPVLFQDGVFNWASGRRTCGEGVPEECMKRWTGEGFQRSSVNMHSRNLGPPHMFWWVLEEMTERFEDVLILEDDFVLGEDYIEVTKSLLEQFGEMGVVSGHGHSDSPRDKEKRRKKAYWTRSGMFHLWGWGIRKEVWREIRGKYEEYLEFIGDFRRRDNEKIRRWFRQHGADLHATGSDGGLFLSLFASGYTYTNVVVNRGAYIGRVGTNMTEDLWKRWDWPSLPVEPYPPGEFLPPEDPWKFLKDLRIK